MIMMCHRIARLFRHRLRDVAFAVLGVALLSLYVTRQSSGSLHLKEDRVVMETNSKNDRTRNGVGVEKMGGKVQSGSGNQVFGVQRNILEGMEFSKDVDGPTRDDQREDGDEQIPADKRRADEDVDEEDEVETSALFAHLQKLEDAALSRFKDAAKVAVVRGQDDVIHRDLPLYRLALEKQGFSVKVTTNGVDDLAEVIPRNTRDDIEANLNNTTPSKEWEGWLVLLCMAFGDGDGDSDGCLKKTSFGKLDSYQKPSENQTNRSLYINRIPGLRDVLWRKDGFCYTMNEARRIPALRRSQLSPLCWVMPAQFDSFLSVADALGTDVRWVFKSPSPGGTIQVLQPARERDYFKVKQYRSQRAVVQQYFPNPLLVFGSPVNIRAYVLVTSINPLRAYLHSEGLVFFRHEYQKGFKKIPSKTWYLAQFKQFLVHNFGSQVANMAFRNMETVIVETLLVAEPSLVAEFRQFSHPWEHPYRCEHCFQLLGFDIIFNSTLHPIVVEVNGQPHLQASDADQQWASNTIKQTTVEESMAILFSTDKVAGEVALAMENLPADVGVVGINCESHHRLCLTDADLEYLLSSRRESRSMGSFRQLYPSPDILKYTALLHDLERFISSHFQFNNVPPYAHLTKNDPTSGTRHSTKELHSVIGAIEQHYVEEEQREIGYVEEQGGGVASVVEHIVNRTESRKRGYFDSLINNVFGLDLHEGNANAKEPRCSENRDTMPYLSAIHTSPPLNLSTTFDPTITEYYATVSHDQVLIQAWAFAMSCDCEARLEDKYGISRPANYTMGIGHNRINFLVVDVTHSEPWVLNTYTLHIHRKEVNEDQVPLSYRQGHEVCSLVQDCDLQYLPNHQCGLRLLPLIRWPETIAKADTLPVCNHGNAPGQWLVPCVQCTDSESCDWREARWQPHDCRHEVISQSELKECLAGKKILFVGDSTNRGIMYYLMERVNGTLHEWDKTHDLKVYANLNKGRTSVSFSYYPQFWLPALERPVFDRAIYQLLKVSRPLENNTDTVIVVGGVHWLATHHLNVLQNSLEREGLTGIQKIMKGLGAGFHQPVDGIHCLTLHEQRKVYLHNRGLHDAAVDQGYEVIDTFNMTMARYRDFLQGKCACHFHKVEEVSADDLSEGAFHDHRHTARRETKQDPARAKGTSIDPQDLRYHVTGRINAIYSEILLGQICKR